MTLEELAETLTLHIDHEPRRILRAWRDRETTYKGLEMKGQTCSRWLQVGVACFDLPTTDWCDNCVARWTQMLN